MLFKTIMSEDVETEKEGQEDPKEETGIISNQISEEGVEREEGEGEEEEVEVAQDHELKVLPENEEEDKEEILITDATKRPPTAKTTKIINKKQRGGGRRRRKALPDEMTKILNRQTVEIDKMALLVQSILKQLKPLKIQPELIKQLQSQLRQIQKQMSQIQKGIIITKKQQNKNKKKGE
ncbi:MAG: hypothetical protein ACJ72J_05345 [Nitrososphaeraceae archaeon]